MTGRIRSIKPEWLEDELLASASDEARVLSVALILMADDYGRGRASLAQIAALTWRYQMERDPIETLARSSRAIRELAEMRFVSLYEVDRQRYFEVRNWSKHQKVDKPSRPRIPAPEDGCFVSDFSFLGKGSRGSREDSLSLSRVPRQTLAPDLDLDLDHDQDQVSLLRSSPPSGVAVEGTLAESAVDVTGRPEVAAPSQTSTLGPAAQPEQGTTAPVDTAAEIAKLEARYPAELSVAVRAACARHRTTGRMADTVWLATLLKLEAYDAGRVVDAMRKFADRYATGQWDEHYLLGIVRNETKEAKRSSGWRPPTGQSDYLESATTAGELRSLFGEITDEDRARVERLGNRRPHG